VPYDLNIRGTRIVVHTAPNRRRDAELRRAWSAITNLLAQRPELAGLVVVAGHHEAVARCMDLGDSPHSYVAGTVRADLFTDTLSECGGHELANRVGLPLSAALMRVVLCVGEGAYAVDLEVSKASTALPAVALT